MNTNPKDVSVDHHEGTDLPVPGDCILFSTADWDTPYWTNKQHTTDHLAQAGWRVLYVESVGLRTPKIGSGVDIGRIFRRLLRGMRGPRQVSDKVWVLSPLVLPFKHHHPLVRWFNQGFLAWTLSRFCRRQAFKTPMLWTYHPFVLEQLQHLRGRHNYQVGKLVYHCVDDLSAIPGIDANAFNVEEARLLSQADVVFTTSETLLEKCRLHNANVHNFPNVVDVAHFSLGNQPGPIPEDLAVISSPRIGYVGALSDFKVNFDLLLSLAQSNPQWQFVIIGEEREGQSNPVLASMSQLKNVHLLGHRSYKQLPEYLRGMDVGLLPTLINDYTRSMFPMKYFEYVAAGLPVVSTSLDFTKRTDSPVELLRADDAAGFSRAIADQLSRGRYSTEQAEHIVADNSWTVRLRKMLRLIASSSSARYG